jgi:hypothetical protein
MKVVDILKKDSDDLVPKLEKLLDLAKQNRISNFVSIYFDSESCPCYSMSYRDKDRLKIVGLLGVMIDYFNKFFQVD